MFDASPSDLNDQTIGDIILVVIAYLREEREKFLPRSVPLSVQQKARMEPYFAADLLDRIRIVRLVNERLLNPGFYARAKARGFRNFPEFSHFPSLTFVDVAVFSDSITPRNLFHALVRAAQIALLGLPRYVELNVKGFLKVGLWVSIPLESHAFEMEARFMAPVPDVFSVDDEIRLWVRDNKY